MNASDEFKMVTRFLNQVSSKYGYMMDAETRAMIADTAAADAEHISRLILENEGLDPDFEVGLRRELRNAFIDFRIKNGLD